MKIATWNISAGINTNDYVGEFFDKTKEASVDDRCLNDIANAIIENNIDVIALQEVVTTESFKYMEKLSEKTGLKFFETFENSPCHLIENANFGVAVLSRYPIKLIKKQFFEKAQLDARVAFIGVFHIGVAFGIVQFLVIGTNNHIVVGAFAIVNTGLGQLRHAVC